MSRRSLNKIYLVMVLFAATALGGCQTPKPQIRMPSEEKDPTLSVYLKDFQQQGKSRGIAIDEENLTRLRVIMFVDDVAAKKSEYGQAVANGEDLAGTCTDAEVDDTMGTARLHWITGTHKWSEVWVAASMNGGSEDQKMSLRELMFHELGHCLLGRNHATGTEHHIMSPSLGNDPKWLRDNWPRLVDELFGRATLAPAD